MFICLLLVICASFFGGCMNTASQSVSKETAQQDQSKQVTIVDSAGRTIVLPHSLKKVAVTNAYNVELITAIGAVDTIVGVDYHIYQDQEGFGHRFTEKNLIGKGQNELNYERIIEMQPDALIITGNGAWQGAEEKLKPFGIPVIVVNAYFTNEFEQNVTILGKAFGKEQEAQEFSQFFMKKLNYIKEQLKDVPKRTVYFEYRKAGQTTVPGDYFFYMVEYSGAQNIYKNGTSRQISIEDVVTKNPQYIVKVSSPDVYSSYVAPTSAEYEAIRKDIVGRPGWDDIEAVKQNHILLISHYGHGGAAKLIGAMYMAKFIYPEYLPELNPEDVFYTWVTKYQRLPYRPHHSSPDFPRKEAL